MTRSDTTPPPTKGTKPRLTLDIGKYEAMLAHSDASPEEKQELIEVLWNLICEFVTIGYEVHPVQQALKDKGCGQDELYACMATSGDSSMVESEVITLEEEV